MKVPKSKFQVPEHDVASWMHESANDAWILREKPESSPTSSRPHDLEERTAQFGETIIRFVRKIPRNPANDRLIGQLTGCGTSVGPIIVRRVNAFPKRISNAPISRCVKEAKETRFFLRMVATAEPKLADEARMHYREARELHMIFASMYRK
jgi:four helix bundle protein